MKKRGRKSGSGSFTQVSLEELNRVLKPHARVIVWGRYAQMLGLEGKKVEAKYDTLVAAVNGGQADVELETFGNAKQTNKKSEVPKDELVPKPEITLEVF